MANASYKPGQVAELLGVSVDTVRRWADAGQLKTRRTRTGQRLIDGPDLARFLSARRGDAEAGAAGQSARNRLPGIVTQVVKDKVMAQVEIQAGPHRVVSLMTREAADELGLVPGVLAVAVVKSTNVVVERTAGGVVRSTLAALLLALAACAGDAGGGTLRVFAAASLTEAFTELGAAFEADHPDVDVAFTFGGSSALARQLSDGADADVFASADEEVMAEALEAGDVRAPEVVARNRLAVVVEEGNPRDVRGLVDLAAPGMVVVLCAPEVPCGRLAQEALAHAGVDIRPASLEEDVKAVVSKVALGEADAGLAYATDVRAAGDDVDGVDVDPPFRAAYPMAITSRATHTAAARAWADFVTSSDGRRVLGEHGFLGP